MPVKGTYLALAGGGALLLWSGIKGKKFSAVLRNVVSGQNPQGAQTAALITSGMAGDQSGGGGGGTVPDNTGLHNMVSQIAKQKGWDAQEVRCWLQLISSEATSPTSVNPSTGAYGWGQALGHGTQGSAGCGRNEYGGYGLSDPQAQRANCGSAPEQLLWMANYIEYRYGTPCNAWNFHVQNGWY